MMLWLARVSWAALGAYGDPLPAAGRAGACAAPLAMGAEPALLAESAEPPWEQPASRTAPDNSTVQVSAAVRRGPRQARAREVVSMPLGRGRPRPGSAGPATVR